jgi:chromosome segregation ATPase
MKNRNQMTKEIEELDSRLKESDQVVFDLELKVHEFDEENIKLKASLRRKEEEIRGLLQEQDHFNQLMRRKDEDFQKQLQLHPPPLQKPALQAPSQQQLVPVTKERIIYISKDNRKELKINSWKFANKYSLSKLLLLVRETEFYLFINIFIDFPFLS